MSEPVARSEAERRTSMNAAEVVQLLSSSKFFGGLASSYLSRITEIGQEEGHPAGAVVFAEGDIGDKFYLILEGAVRISRMVPGMGEEALAVLRPGAHFGEMALLDESPRSAHAIVHERCRLFALRKEDLEDLLFVDRDMAYELLWHFVRTLSSRLRETNDKMTFLSVTTRF